MEIKKVHNSCLYRIPQIAHLYWIATNRLLCADGKTCRDLHNILMQTLYYSLSLINRLILQRVAISAKSIHNTVSHTHSMENLLFPTKVQEPDNALILMRKKELFAKYKSALYCLIFLRLHNKKCITLLPLNLLNDFRNYLIINDLR